MRWLVGHPGPNFSVHDLYVGWTEALRGLGEDVFTFNMDARLQFYDSVLMETGTFDDGGRAQVHKALPREKAVEQAAYGILGTAFQCWPQVVLLVSAFFIPEYLMDMLRGRGMKVVLLHSESPYQDEAQLVRAAHADVNLVNDPVNLDRFAELGPAAYVPHAYRPAVHHPGPAVPDLTSDLAFVGTGFKSRVEFFEAMDLDGLDVLLAGAWMDLAEDSPLRKYVPHDTEECCDNERTAEVYRSARTGINFYRRESEDEHAGEGWACGPREIEMAAAQLLFLRDKRGEGDGLFPMLPTFDGPQDASEKLRWWLAHDAEREKAAAAARTAIADRTFENNARRLLDLLSRQPVRV